MDVLTIPVGPLQCNCYVFGDRTAAYVIDPGDEGDRIVAELRRRGIRPALILNTHGHFDHIGGVEAVKAAFGAPYLIHRGELDVMRMVPAGTKLWGIAVPPPPAPSGFLEPAQRWNHGTLSVEALHTPGHTPGSTCFHVPAFKAVFTGDTLFLGSIGRSDFPGGNGPLLVESIRTKLLSLPPETKVYPGHGPPSTIGHEAENNPFLV